MLVASNPLPSAIFGSNAPIEREMSPLTSSFNVVRGNFEQERRQGELIPIALNLFKINMETAYQVVDVVINGSNYQLSNNPTPEIGEYYINTENAEIIINPGYDVTGLTGIYTTVDNRAKTNKLSNLSSLLKEFIVIEDINISQNFQGHPSGTIRVRCDRLSYPAIRNELKPGTPLHLLGIDFRTKKLDQEKTLDRFGHILIVVSLQGYWEKQGNTYRCPLDEPIKERELIDDSNECSGFQYSYKDALAKVGVNLLGGNIVKKVSKNLTDNATTTVRQLLENQKRLLVYGYYVDWTSRQGIRLKKWEQPKIFMVDHLVADLSKSQDFAGITISENGFGSEVDGCFLTYELNGAELKLEEDPNGENEGDEYICLTQGDRNPQAPPQELSGFTRIAFDYNRLRSPALAFDNNGGTKSRIIRCQLNGSDLEVTEETYGFPFSSADVYNYRIDNNGNIIYFFKGLAEVQLNVSWELVRLLKYQYIYNPQTGYFEERIGRGWELKRDLQETEDKEAITLVAAIALETDTEAIAELEKQLRGYTNFYKKTLTADEIHELEDLSNHYADLVKPNEGDLEFIPSLFSKQSTTEENSLLIRPDPRSTVDDPQPDLILGTQNREIKQTEINSTAPEKFINWNLVTNQEGTNLEQSAASESFAENAGRPPMQNRLIKRSGCNKRKTEPQDKTTKYLVSTPGVIPFDTPPQTLSYPGAYTLSQALKAATIDYQIKNSQSACTTQLPLGENIPQLRAGDLVVFKGKHWRVFSHQLTASIQPNTAIAKSITLNVGKNIELNLSVKYL